MKPVSDESPVCVVGGGISGLAAAYFLHRRGRAVRVLEASERLGGNIRTERHDGFVYDIGPDSFLRTKPHAADLCRDLGLEEELISPSEQAVYVAYDGMLHPMPEGLALGVPTRLSALLDTSLLSGQGKLRAMCEPFVPARHSDDEETIQSFTRRRLGTEMADRVAGALLSGVFAGDPARLSINATFPQLPMLERKYGSLFRGMSGGKSLLRSLTSPRPKPPSPFLSLRSGLGLLVERLREELPASSVSTRSPVVSLAQGPSGARITFRDAGGDEQLLEASHVVFAGPPWQAAPLLGALSPDLGAQLRAIPGSPTATVFFGLSERAMHTTVEGSGFIVPPGEGEILAATWTSSKWENRAPAGRVLLRAFLGGARAQGSLAGSDAEIIGRARVGLERLMGSLGRPLFARVFRWERGTPQPELGHEARLAAIRSHLADFPWLSLVGSGYGGVGIPDCVRQAAEVAERLAPAPEKAR